MTSLILKLNDNAQGIWITGARLPGYSDPQQLWIDPQGLIQRIQPQQALGDWPGPVWDVGGDWLSLGGVDLQINGALGLAFPDLTAANQNQLQEISQVLWQQGVDGFLPTIVTSPLAKIRHALATIADFLSLNQSTEAVAEIYGVHLEGPFLNPVKRGAHPQEHLLPLEREQLEQVLGDYAALVKVITLAPELDVEGKAIAHLVDLGIIVSLGHSLATASQAQAAFDRGATMVTHAFNAMPGLHHREPGLLGAAILDPRVWCGVIADGEHICPPMLEILLRTQGEGAGYFLVSDALAPLGLPDGFYPWDERQMQVKNGTARLPEGTLCGTTLPLLAGVANLVQWGILPWAAAIALGTEAPRKAIGLPGLGLGQPARNLLRWQQHPTTGAVTWQRLFATD